MLYREVIEVETKEGVSFTDITERIANIAANSGIRDGVCHVFMTGTTAGIMLNENERMLLEDFKRLFKSLADEDRMYSHAKNAFSHLRAIVAGAEKTLPMASGSLVMGERQSMLIVEFDIKPRKRQLIITIIGE